MSSMRSASSSTKVSTWREVDLALLHQVEQASRRRDQHVEAAAQRLHLRALADAAEDHVAADAAARRVLRERGADLRRELARRCQHQRADRMPAAAALVREQRIEDRQREGRRLAGAGLRAAEHVAAREHVRNGLQLDRGRLRVASGAHGRGQRGGEIERVPARGRSGRWTRAGPAAGALCASARAASEELDEMRTQVVFLCGAQRTPVRRALRCVASRPRDTSPGFIEHPTAAFVHIAVDRASEACAQVRSEVVRTSKRAVLNELGRDLRTSCFAAQPGLTNRQLRRARPSA